MAFHKFASLAHDDDQLYDLAKGMGKDYEPPEYPSACQFTLSREDLEQAGADMGDPGETMKFSAMGEVTSIHKDMDGCRIELQLGEFAGEDGKFFDLSTPSYICLCGPELEKMDLDSDCERGDTIHLIGMARLERSSSTEFADQVTLQITDLTFEDESTESRMG